MAAPDDGDRRDAYQRRQDEQRPLGRKPGENRAEHRKRLRNEKRSKAHNAQVEPPTRPAKGKTT